ncbi:hypothetical protein M011DRAFT_522742 [Sporormia fimetaria CBS 119925]|uniref:Rhodopsin domain-containing protein n=1 Tax=Sporormia fimetaria CBS 119925 TaxID=1340428 RepID=A0A6A6VQD1_9PLEO|nr:hypothetical protein M011DRAFT_522742 [Sporormia fimetaria CBS 119925]
MDSYDPPLQSGISAPRSTGNGTWYPVSDNAFHLAYTHLVATLFCQIVALFFISARVYTRAFPVWRFAADDYIICFAFACMSIAIGLWYRANFWAWGHHHPPFRHVSEITYTSKLGMIALPFWGWATGLVKISIGVMLLRFQQNRRLRGLTWAMIALNIALILLVGVVSLFSCVPYAANWDMQKTLKGSKCWGRAANRAIIYTPAVCNTLTDVVFSLMPLTFLRKIRRPTGEKVVIGGLMALGLIASAFSLSKVIVNGKLDVTKDRSASFLLLALLSALEVQTALIAACAPTLRSATQRFLRRIGLGQCHQDSTPPPYAVGSSTFRDTKVGHSGIRELDRVHYGRLNSPYNDSGSALGDDARYEQDPTTGRIVCTTELKIHSSHSNVRSQWESHEGWIMEDQWKARGGIGVAR